MKNILLSTLLLAALAGCRSTPKPSAAVAAPAEAYEQEAVMTVKSKFLDNGTSSRVFLELDVKRLYADADPLAKLAAQFTIKYALLPEVGSKDLIREGNVPLTAGRVRNKLLTVAFDVPKPANYATAVLIAEITDAATGQKLFHTVPLRFVAARLTDRFALFDRYGQLPTMRHYTAAGDTFQIRDLAGTSRKLFAYRYNHEFEPAFAPMAVSAKTIKRTMRVDSTFEVSTNVPLVFDQQRLYFFLEDTTQVYGLGMRIVDKRYPRYTRPEQLTRPLVYVSTNDEVRAFESTTEPKKSLDKYWLRLSAGNAQLARRTIKAYYRRVTEANRLFTTYKEGWKTDMGMVYIVFGPPNRVQYLKDKEVWTYAQSANYAELNFNFVKRPNLFVEDHYELLRYVDYEPYWYPTVEEWRTGVAAR